MYKLYDKTHYANKHNHFVVIDNAPTPTILQKQVKDLQGRTITYDYYATAEKTTKSPYKALRRKIAGWFLYITSLGYLSRYSSVRAWMKGRRIDHIYIAKESCSPTVPSRSLKTKHPIKLNNLLTKGDIAEFLKGRHLEDYALELFLFADKHQDISPILKKYLPQLDNKERDEKNRLLTLAAIEVLEQSLGVKFGDNIKDDEKIITAFISRRICRSYHGTRKVAAKAIMQNGISYDRKSKFYHSDEFVKLLDECRLEEINFPLLRERVKRDSSKFYVTYQASFALDYARNNSPEWFCTFKRWASNESGAFDEDKLRSTLREKNPKITDIDRVVQFVQNHWEPCGSDKKTAAILIVEQNENDPDLYHNDKRFHSPFLSNIMCVYHSFSGSTKLDKLVEAIKSIPSIQGFNHGLSAKGTQEPPKVIQGIKIALKSPIEKRLWLKTLSDDELSKRARFL